MEDSYIVKRNKLEILGRQNEIVWYQQFKHTSSNSLCYAASKIDALKLVKFTDRLRECKECLRARFATQLYKKEREGATRPLQLVHTNMCSGFPPSYNNQRTMFISVINNFSRYAQLFTI